MTISDMALVTGATGMVGSHAARRLVESGRDVRVLVRPGSDRSLLEGLDVEIFEGDLGDYACFPDALRGVSAVIHAGARVGDWGPAEGYRAVNVVGLEHMIAAARREPRFRRWVQVSSLGVYPARHHFGTDETVPVDLRGLDGYTRSKAEAEVILNRHIADGFPAVILRPGFVYGIGDRHVLPRLVSRFRQGAVRLIGEGIRQLNNTYVGNFGDAILLALGHNAALGQTFNIRDGRLVTRAEYLTTVADHLGLLPPHYVPLWLAHAARPAVEGIARLRGATEPPLLTRATLKFMTLNLDYSIEKAKAVLGYRPRVDFQDGMREAVDWAIGDRSGIRALHGARRQSTGPRQ